MKKACSIAAMIAGMIAVAGCSDVIVEPDVPIVDIQVDNITPQDTSADDEGSRPDTVDDEGAACIAGFGYEGVQEDPEMDADIRMSTNQTRDVPVYYRDCEGNDGDRIVTFEQVDGTDFCQLQVEMDYTDDSGLALAPVKSLENSGYCHIKACPDGMPDECVIITIYVDPKTVTPLRVKFAPYGGNNFNLSKGIIRLYKKTPEKPYNCADMDPRKLPSPATVQASEIAIIGGVSVFATLPGLKEELQQDYTVVGMAYEKDDAKNMRAWACDDTTGHVELGDMTVVTLNLIDVVPSIVGDWDIDSNFDLTSGLPPTVDKILDILIGLFTSPTGQVLLLMCDESILGLNIGTDICGYIFADPEDPVLGEYGTVGTFVVSIVDQIIVNLLKNNCPYENDPTLCSKIYFTGRDVGAILQKFRIKSTMKCTVEPKVDWANPEAGAIISKGDCKETWHTVIFRWSLGADCDQSDPECGAKYFSMASIPGIEQAITAEISGKVTDGQYLHIDPHAVNLKYGALINFALEKILLPQVFGDGSDGLPAVNSYEALIGSLLAGRQCLTTMSCCSDFDNTLTAKYTWLPAGLAEGACDALLQTVVGYIRDQLNALDSTPENFRLGTPPDDPAKLFDTNRDMTFDTIGNQMELCNWDAKLTIGGFTYDPIGLFWGLRN